MRPGEIYLAQFPFGDVPGMKLRPVLLLTGAVGSVPEVLVSYISSVIPSQLLPSDLVLDPAKPEFRSTNLKTLSTLRLHKLATIHTSSLVRYLGVVDGPTLNNVAKYTASQIRIRIPRQPLPYGRGSDRSRARQQAVSQYTS